MSREALTLRKIVS
jgi:hypothetical protein